MIEGERVPQSLPAFPKPALTRLPACMLPPPSPAVVMPALSMSSPPVSASSMSALSAPASAISEPTMLLPPMPAPTLSQELPGADDPLPEDCGSSMSFTEILAAQDEVASPHLDEQNTVSSVTTYGGYAYVSDLEAASHDASNSSTDDVELEQTIAALLAIDPQILAPSDDESAPQSSPTNAQLASVRLLAITSSDDEAVKNVDWPTEAVEATDD